MGSLKEWINESLSAENTRVSITDFEEDFKVSFREAFILKKVKFLTPGLDLFPVLGKNNIIN